MPITDLQVASAQCDATGRLEALRVRERRIGVGARAQGVREADHVHQSEIDEIVRTDGHREARGEIPDEGTHPEQSEAIRGNQMQSEAIKGFGSRARTRPSPPPSHAVVERLRPLWEVDNARVDGSWPHPVVRRSDGVSRIESRIES